MRSAAFVFCATMTISANAAADRPNVLFLLTDDQRADTIAANGNRHIKTANMDRLVAEGFVFRNAYCMGSTISAVCLPSRTMLLSGRSLYRLEGAERRINLAKSFADAGYETWHIGKRGNTPHALHTAFAHSTFLNDQKERYSGHSGRTEIDAALEFLKNRSSDKPFCMLIEFTGPHDPRVARPEFLALYEANAIPLPTNYRPYHPFDNGDLVLRDELLEAWPRSEDAVRRHLHEYYATISHIDAQMGRLFDALEKRGEWGRTVVVLTSDHGLAIGSHGLFGKQNLYEVSMNPGIVFRGPGIPHGQSSALAYLFDIYPTLCGLAGITVPDDIDGRNLTPVIQGQTASVRDTVFLAYRHLQRAVRQGDWKLLRYPEVNYTQLFNLVDDPHEIHNLADKPDQAHRVASMLALLADQQQYWNDTLPLSAEAPKPAMIDPKNFFPGRQSPDPPARRK